MSVAFRRESDEEHKEPRFELPIPAGPNLVTVAGKQLIEDRLSAIEAELAGCTDKDAVELLMRQKRYWQTRHQHPWCAHSWVHHQAISAHSAAMTRLSKL